MVDIRAFADLVLNKIKERTMRGVGADGQPFKPYSTHPFSMPYGAVASLQKMQKAIKNKDARTFQRSGGALWIVWTGGYKSYKSYMQPNTDTNVVNLMFSGSMLRNFKVLDTNSTPIFVDLAELNITGISGTYELAIPAIEVVLGFDDNALREIAYQNILKGRDFLGLTDTEINEVFDYLIGD